MLSDFIIRSTAAFGGAPFRFNKCTALSSAGSGAAIGEAFNKFEDKLRVVNSYKFYTDGELFEDGTKKIYFKSNARIRIENPDMKTYDYSRSS